MAFHWPGASGAGCARRPSLATSHSHPIEFELTRFPIGSLEIKCWKSQVKEAEGERRVFFSCISIPPPPPPPFLPPPFLLLLLQSHLPACLLSSHRKNKRSGRTGSDRICFDIPRRWWRALFRAPLHCPLVASGGGWSLRGGPVNV